MKVGLNSDRGRIRENNEDDYLALDQEEFKLFAVADGMGGHSAGEVASSMAIQILEEYDFKLINPAQEIKELIEHINAQIFKAARENIEYKGMGTTLTLALFYQGQFYIGHIGDSRAYLLRQGELKQLTEDHSLVNRLVKAGEISVAEAKDHPQSNVLLKALGIQEKVEVDLLEVELKTADLFLLCSDGLSGVLEDSLIKEVLLAEGDLQQKADQLVRLANRNGGYDNITVNIFSN